MSKILAVKNVSKKYNTIDGEIRALDDISFLVDLVVNVFPQAHVTVAST